MNERAADITYLKYRIDGREGIVTGRLAWTLHALILAGSTGITSLTTPGPRLSAYILKLRRAGIPISTLTTMHGGSFPGHHATYRLGVHVELVEARAAA